MNYDTNYEKNSDSCHSREKRESWEYNDFKYLWTPVFKGVPIYYSRLIYREIGLKWSKEASIERVWKHSLKFIEAKLNLSEWNTDGSHTIAKKMNDFLIKRFIIGDSLLSGLLHGLIIRS